jgi:hypothetical protein
MKNYLIISFLFLSFILKSQITPYNGLELYNLHMLNPAFNKTENKAQFDMIGYVRNTKLEYSQYGYVANSILNLKGINSSIRASYSNSNHYYQDYQEISLGYAYRLDFSDKFKLHSGISINSSTTIENNSSIALSKRYEDINTYTHRNSNIEPGIALIISRLTLGATARINLTDLKQWDYFSNYDTSLSKSGYSGSFLSAIYDFKPLGKFNIQLSFHKDIYHFQELLTDTYFSDDYLGLIINYNNLFGLGFTFGDEYAIIGDVRIDKNSF